MKGEKIFKQVASIITIVLLLQYVSILAPLMQVRAESATVDGIAWTYETDSNGNAVNVKPSDINSITGDVTIPSELDGHSVINMGDYAFQNCSGLTGITMPSSITSIAYGLFRGCSALKNITIQGQITIIGGSAFYECSSLTGITIPSSVTSIGESAFYNCSSLTNITIPNKVTGIGMNTFCGCSKLANVIIGDGVTYISNWAFIDCSELKSINLPKSLESISTSAFAGCKNLTNIEIPENVESIGNYVFSGCSSLSNVEIPNSVTSIGDYAFSECSNLSSIKIPNSVTSIGEKAFNECKNLLFICEKDSYAYEYAKENNIIVEAPTIIFDDINLYSKIKEICNKNGQLKSFDDEEKKVVIIKKDEINELDLSNSNINDLTGIENFTELESLNISNNNIKNISSLEGLASLKSLNLDNNKIDDIRILDNKEFTYLSIKNQKIEISTSESKNELPDIIKKATQEKYSNGEIVSYNTNNCSIVDNNIVLKNEFNTNETATIVVNNGVMAGTTCTITMKATEAIRKNGKIYILANNSYYSLTGDNYKRYIEPLENTDAKEIYVRIGDGAPEKISIVDAGKEYDMYDTNINNEDAMSMHRWFIERKNGKATLKYSELKSNLTHYKNDNIYYSYDRNTWIYLTQDLQINDINASKVYIKVSYKEYGKESETITEYNIVDNDKIYETTSIYNEDGNSFIFGNNKMFYEKDNGTKRFVINNPYSIEKFSKDEVLDVTTFSGNVFVLKSDKKVYKIINKYDNVQAINSSDNFVQIEGVYALDNENNIWKCEYNGNIDNEYEYKKCNYNIERKIKDISYTYLNNKLCPVVLYVDGQAEILQDENSKKTIGNGIINISRANACIYLTSLYSVIEVTPEGTKNINLSSILQENEIIIKINSNGYILTNKGNIYKPNITKVRNVISINSYQEKPIKTNIRKMGDYTYQDKSGKTYYLNVITSEGKYKETSVEVEKKIEDISITKDESTLKDNKVAINITIPEGKYTIKLPNNETTNKSSKYEVSENGVYKFEFTDKTGYTVIRTVHVTNIQNRKETKIPEVTVVNGKVKLESNEKIEYSQDNQNWSEYKGEFTYTAPIYAKVVSDKYECSIIKITIEGAKLSVENTESREIREYILTNGIGATSQDIFEKNKKVINFALEVAEKTTPGAENKKKNLFDYISEIASDIIYSASNKDKYSAVCTFAFLDEVTEGITYNFSRIDGQYAGCYFDDDVSEVTYKNYNNDTVSIKDDSQTINNISNNSSNIDYGILVDAIDIVEKDTLSQLSNYEIIDEYTESQRAKKATEISGKEYVAIKTKKYAYIDNLGNLVSNIEIVNEAKERIGKNENYTKIIGDGSTFYILTQTGNVYIISDADNDYFSYLKNEYGLWRGLDYAFEDYIEKKGSSLGLYQNYPELRTIKESVICKLKLNNIIDIYDSCTALTSDGKMVSLKTDNEEDDSVIQELQKQTDKYLITSHLGLKNGKLYNFENVREGYEALVGKIVKSDTPQYTVYNEKNKTIKISTQKDDKGNVIPPTLSDGEIYVTVEETDIQSPEFVDIAEYRSTYMNDLDFLENQYKTSMAYAITKDGDVWTYIDGHIINTGINLDYFGPTSNYSLSNTEVTKDNIDLNISANTTNNTISAVIKRGTETIAQLNKEDFKNNKVEISKNGNYEIEVIDGKGRTYTSIAKVENIDKLAPYTPVIQKSTSQIIFKDDREATQDYAKSGIRERLISYDGVNWTKVDGQTYSIATSNNKGTIYAKTIDNAGNESEIAKANFTQSQITVKYEDVNGKTLKEEKIITGYVDEEYKLEREEIEDYNFVEVKGSETGKFTEENQTVIFVYEKQKGKVIVKYQDEEGNSIKEDVIFTDEVGVEYSVNEETIDGYEYIEVVGNKEGKYTKEDQEVIFKYKKIQEEKPIIPQTGQFKIIYLILGIIIILSIGSLICIDILKNKKL